MAQAPAFQVSCLQVFIETVDSFQGKQLDVVILSCVRAGTGGGLGFVTDVRCAFAMVAGRSIRESK